jgi:hypothetical protein
MMGWLRGSRADGGETVVLVVVPPLCRNWESCHRAIGGFGAGKAAHHNPQPHPTTPSRPSSHDHHEYHKYHKLHHTPACILKNQEPRIPRLPSIHARSPFQTSRAKDIRLPAALIVSLIHVLPKCEATGSLGPRRVEVSVIRTRTVLLTAHLLQE